MLPPACFEIHIQISDSNLSAGLLSLIIESSPEDQRNIASIAVIIWFSAVFSAVLDNIPYTITMLPVIRQLPGRSN